MQDRPLTDPNIKKKRTLMNCNKQPPKRRYQLSNEVLEDLPGSYWSFNDFSSFMWPVKFKMQFTIETTFHGALN